MSQTSFSERPEGFIVLGWVIAVMLAVAGAAGFLVSNTLGVVAVALGGSVGLTIVGIGVIAKGVEVGMRARGA